MEADSLMMMMMMMESIAFDVRNT